MTVVSPIRQDMDIKWALSQILLYRGANRPPMGGISGGLQPKIPPQPLTVPAASREIIKELI
jgi:hypothetical protein